MIKLFKDPRVDFFRDELFGPSFLNTPALRTSEVKETGEGNYEIQLNALGFTKEDLTIETEGDSIKVSGMIGREVPGFVTTKNIDRVWELTNLDPKSVDAALENGILTLKFGVKESSKPKKSVIKLK